MASHAGREGTNAHPGIKLLADELGLKERQTKTIVASLVRLGWLAQTSPGRGDRHFAAVHSAADCTLDVDQVGPRCNPVKARVQSAACEGATDCTPNQPSEITKESPFNQSVSDDLPKGSTAEGLTDTVAGDEWGLFLGRRVCLGYHRRAGARVRGRGFRPGV
jgi:hypothetical protein